MYSEQCIQLYIECEMLTDMEVSHGAHGRCFISVLIEPSICSYLTCEEEEEEEEEEW